jgi:hypothetical protein
MVCNKAHDLYYLHRTVQAIKSGMDKMRKTRGTHREHGMRTSFRLGNLMEIHYMGDLDEIRIILK